MTKTKKELKKIIKGKVRFNEPLARHTTFQIGGKCEAWIEPENMHDLVRVLIFARSRHKDVMVIGRGSNILARDGFHKMFVIHLGDNYFNQLKVNKNIIKCGAGVNLSRILSTCRNAGLSGLEFTAGIPATLGGAINTNAGGADGVINDQIESLVIVDAEGRLKVIDRPMVGESDIIVQARFLLKKSSTEKVNNRIKYFLKEKKRNQDLARPSAGCIFKNLPKGTSTGALIEKCGLKGVSYGQATISTKHANYIINKGQAKAAHVRKLISLIQDKVMESHGIKLEPEIKIL